MDKVKEDLLTFIIKKLKRKYTNNDRIPFCQLKSV